MTFPHTNVTPRALATAVRHAGVCADAYPTRRFPLCLPGATLHTRATLTERTMALSVIYVLMGFFIIVRLFFLQVIEFDKYDALASGQHDIFEQLVPKRGEIGVD